MQEVDADRRLQLLRGERLEPLPLEEEHDTSHKRKRDDGSPHRKKRRMAGEDDTDRDMRLAREAAAAPTAVARKVEGHDAPLVDHNGHISLFPQVLRHAEKNPEAESEAAKKKREFEDQYTMRFSNAAGFKQSLENPWYSSTTAKNVAIQDKPGKDVWGNEDLGRRDRETQRLSSTDPLAAMKTGVRKLREADRHRKEWMEERERDLKEVEEMARENRRQRSRKDDDLESLEGFNLETGYEEKRHERRNHHSGHGEESRHERHRQHNRREGGMTVSTHRSYISEDKRSVKAHSRT